MSKKSRRERRPNLPPEAFNAPVKPVSAPPQPAPAQSLAAAPVAAAPVAAAPNWHREYGEVMGDLKRTVLIFAALVVIMIVLSFVIR